jgi:dihydroxy-acid dehydratase
MEISSRNVVVGPSRAPHRAMYKAMGLNDEDLGKPFIGVSHTGNEATPCNIHLGRLAQKAKEGVSDSGGTPREFATIAVSDGIAMGHEGMKASLVSREIIADSIEIMVRAHQYDGLVGIAGCDKSLPGTMMGMARLNLPSVFVYGGTIMPGIYEGKPVTVQDVYEAVGSYEAGQLTLEALKNLENVACPMQARVVACILQTPWHQLVKRLELRYLAAHLLQLKTHEEKKWYMTAVAQS